MAVGRLPCGPDCSILRGMPKLDWRATLDELRQHLPATALAVVGLYASAFGIPAIFRAIGRSEPVQSSFPDAPLWLLVLFIVFLGPLVEELIFRRWLIRAFRALSLSFSLSALLSTAFWVAVHVPTSVQTFLIYTITGLILCWLLYKTQRLWTCILAHMTYNVPAALLLML